MSGPPCSHAAATGYRPIVSTGSHARACQAADRAHQSLLQRQLLCKGRLFWPPRWKHRAWRVRHGPRVRWQAFWGSAGSRSGIRLDSRPARPPQVG